jgi:RNA-binding protein
LIKVRFLDFKDMKQSFTDTIVAETGAHLVAIIGHTAILYRQHADPAQRKIQL